MLGYCGINCAKCPAYRGTVSSDFSLLEQSAAGGEGYSPLEWVCLGCKPADQPFIAKYCGLCSIRACAIEKEHSNCAACNDFEQCSRLQDFLQYISEKLVLRMQWLRQCFLETKR